MQTQASAAERGIVVVRGWGIKVCVSRRHLVIEDGIGHDRLTRRYHRASGGIERLVVIGHTGYITLEAVRWLHDIGAVLLHIDADGRLLATSVATRLNRPVLRRAQVLAATDETGVQIARALLRDKVVGQASLLCELPEGDHARAAVERALADIERAQGLSELVQCESRAALAYWGAWAKLPVSIATPGGQAGRGIPDHWRAFGPRHSLITRSPRTATNPPNAILNYLYALLEAETIFGCRQLGLDPGLGIFHSDERDRASLALDIMEAARPAVDAYVLELLLTRTLSANNFGETRQGACRLSAKMAAGLSDTVHAWRSHVAPYIERVAHTLSLSAGSSEALRTPLTRATAVAAWEKRKPDRRRRRPRAALKLPHTCRNCGAELQDPRHRYCGKCHSARSTEQTVAAKQKAMQMLGELRASQRAGGPVTPRGVQNAAHQRAAREWAGERPGPWIFKAEILPGLREVPLPALAAATGLSELYCLHIRSGRQVPHARHWEALRALANEHAS